MSEETLPVGQEQQTESVEQPKADPYESKALEMGWRPKEEWDGPDEDFIDAKEFVRRQPLFEKIEHQSKAIKQIEKAFEALKTHHTKVKEAEYERALKTLKEARKEALREGETDRALAYEEKIEEVEEQKEAFDRDASAVNIPKEPEAHPDFVAWKQQNSWYTRDTELKEFADTYGMSLARQGKDPKEVLEAVAKRVKQAFPEKFRNPNRDKASAVEAPSRRAAQTDSFEMSEEQVRIIKTIVRSGAKTVVEHNKPLKRVKEL